MCETREWGFSWSACTAPACARSGWRAYYPRWTGSAWISRCRAPFARASPATRAEYELRRTWYPHLLSATDLAQLGDEPRTLGTDRLALQEYCVAGCASALPGM